MKLHWHEVRVGSEASEACTQHWTERDAKTIICHLVWHIARVFRV